MLKGLYVLAYVSRKGAHSFGPILDKSEQISHI